MKKHIIQSTFSFFLAVVLSVPTYADAVSPLPESTLDFYNANGIYYYTPTGNNSNSCLLAATPTTLVLKC